MELKLQLLVAHLYLPCVTFSWEALIGQIRLRITLVTLLLKPSCSQVVAQMRFHELTSPAAKSGRLAIGGTRFKRFQEVGSPRHSHHKRLGPSWVRGLTDTGTDTGHGLRRLWLTFIGERTEAVSWHLHEPRISIGRGLS